MINTYKLHYCYSIFQSIFLCLRSKDLNMSIQHQQQQQQLGCVKLGNYNTGTTESIVALNCCVLLTSSGGSANIKLRNSCTVSRLSLLGAFPTWAKWFRFMAVIR